MPVSIKGTGGGSVTLDAGAAAADTTLTLPNTTGTVALTASPTFTGTVTATAITSPSATALTFQYGGTTGATLDTSGNLQFNSGYGSAATAYGCRAWANFNGTGTIAIRGSGGVSSIADQAVGQYALNFSFTMPDANYSTVAVCSDNPGVNPGFVSVIDAGTTTQSPTISASYNSSGATWLNFDAVYVRAEVVR